MAQTGYTPLLIYSSSTVSQAPSAGNLTNSTLGSELAINITDGKLFYKDNANAVQVIAWKTTPTTAGGTGLTSYTAGDMLYYASGTALTKLAIGASTTIMTSSGSAPQWSAASGITVGTATNLAGGVAGSVPYQTAAGTTAMLAIGTSGRWLGSSGTAPQWNAPAALTKTDDTNVTLTLGGSASTALLNAASLTLGWTGQLATTRGGTGLSSFTANGILYASSTSALATGSALTFDGTNFSTTGSATATRFIPTGSTVPTNGMYLSAANTLRFATNSTAGPSIDSSQNLLVGVASKTGGYSGKFQADGMSSVGTNQFNIECTGSGADFEWVMRLGNAMQFYVDNANVVASLSSAGVWTNASDSRYKENIDNIQYGLDSLMALKPRKYNIIGQQDKPQIGFIAQEVLDVVPEVVENTFNTVTQEDRYSLSYGQLTAVIVKAMQEQQAMIEALKARIIQLEGK